MGFLDQLKNQANALQTRQVEQTQDVEANTAACEAACRTTWRYLQDLAQQLNVIQPPGPALSLDGKTPWPPMKLGGFRTDARRKMLRNREVFDHLAMAWDFGPALGGRLPGAVKVNFPPDLERVQNRLQSAQIRHDRNELRHPETRKLLAYEFVYDCAGRASVMVEPDHDRALMHFRLAAVRDLDVHKVSYPAAQVNTALLDELAKLIVAQPSQFLLL